MEPTNHRNFGLLRILRLFFFIKRLLLEWLLRFATGWCRGLLWNLVGGGLLEATYLDLPVARLIIHVLLLDCGAVTWRDDLLSFVVASLIRVRSLFIEYLTVDSGRLNLAQTSGVRVLFCVFHYFLCEFRSVVNCLLKMVRSERSTLIHILLLTYNETWRVVLLLENIHFSFGVCT